MASGDSTVIDVGAAPESQPAIMAGEAQHRYQPQDKLPPPSPPRTGEVLTNLEGLDLYTHEAAQTIVNIEGAEDMYTHVGSSALDIEWAKESLTSVVSDIEQAKESLTSAVSDIEQAKESLTSAVSDIEWAEVPIRAASDMEREEDAYHVLPPPPPPPKPQKMEAEKPKEPEKQPQPSKPPKVREPPPSPPVRPLSCKGTPARPKPRLLRRAPWPLEMKSTSALTDVKRHCASTAPRTMSPPGIISGMTVQHEGHDLILPAYHLVKDEKEAWTLEERLFNQKSPLGNTILHMAAWYGDYEMVDKVIQGAPGLVTQQNLNDDTPLHVAARAGHFSAFQNLFPELFDIDLLITSTNKKGNTILHDALINKENETTIIQLFDRNREGKPLKHVYDGALKFINERNKSVLYLATEMRYVKFVNNVLGNCNEDMIPEGKSPLRAAILNRDKGMLETIIEKKPKWIHLEDQEGRIPLHWAAATGYLDGVDSLLAKCDTCRIVRDNMGSYALHLAAEGGHVEILKKLLSDCPAPWEAVATTGQNILHIAAARGKVGVVKHILRDPKLKIMINEMDYEGNTPLHLATLHSRPKVVYALTRNERVKGNLGQTNLRNQTALDINLEQVDGESQPLRQRLVWTALKSAGTPSSSMRILPQGPDEQVPERKKDANVQQFKDRIDTLIVVSTLIITATFAGGFSLPGESDNGVAANLKHTMFHFYIYCITISMYGATSVTLILIWARLGDISLLAHSLRLARPVLGITVVTLCLAFLAGVYVVISPLGWLATSFLIIATVGAVIVGLLYIVLWLPSSSSFIVCRYISYLPFHLLASWAGEDDDGDHHKSSKH